MYKILFVSALAPELKIVKQELKKLNISKKDLEVSFFESGFWNYKTILNLTNFLSKNKFDFVINIWVCGYKNEKDDLIQVTRIFNLWDKKELISPVFFKFAKIESINCSDNIIYDEELLEQNYVDMESYAFELVCDKIETPRMILKVPVDKVWEETKNFDYKKSLELLKENIDYGKLILSVKDFLEKNNKENNDFSEEEIELKNKILWIYKLTFSQEIILEKLLNKIIVLNLFDLEKFFKENKDLDKKEFLKILQEKI